MLELRRNDFCFMGYQNSGVRIFGKRFLSPEEVETVKTWKEQGKIMENGTWSVTGHGGVYTVAKFRYKSV